MSDKLIAGLRAHIAALGVGCCSCGIKLSAPQWHDARCKVHSVAEALDNVDALEAEVARLREENDILSEMLTERKARAKALEEALAPFRSGAEWGKYLAWLVEGAPSREAGVAAAKAINGWKRAADAALRKEETP